MASRVQHAGPEELSGRLPMARLSQKQMTILKDILSYLHDHPDAKDTPEGIRQWWMPPSIRAPGAEDVSVVLAVLVSAGWLVAIEGGLSSSVVYGGGPKLRGEQPDVEGLSTDGPC